MFLQIPIYGTSDSSKLGKYKRGALFPEKQLLKGKLWVIITENKVRHRQIRVT